MLSIRFGDDREWWTAGETFERLFQAALVSGALSPDLADWQHVATANGGLSLDELDAATADRVRSGLRDTAQQELARVSDVAAFDTSTRVRSASPVAVPPPT